MQMTPDKKKNKLYIVVPCYNEEQVLGETSKRLKKKGRYPKIVRLFL